MRHLIWVKVIGGRGKIQLEPSKLEATTLTKITEEDQQEEVQHQISRCNSLHHNKCYSNNQSSLHYLRNHCNKDQEEDLTSLSIKWEKKSKDNNKQCLMIFIFFVMKRIQLSMRELMHNMSIFNWSNKYMNKMAFQEWETTKFQVISKKITILNLCYCQDQI